MSIGARLREERNRLKMSQPEFASLAATTKQTLFSWESEKTAPDGFQLASLAEAGVDVLYVLTGLRQRDMPAVDSSEQLLLDSYRKCGGQARSNLMQTAVLLAAGVDGGGAQAGKGDQSIQVSSTYGHAAGRDVNVNQKESYGGKKGDKSKRPRGRT